MKGLTRDDIMLDVAAETGAPLPCLKASMDGDDYEAYLTAFPATLLADAYENMVIACWSLTSVRFSAFGAARA